MPSHDQTPREVEVVRLISLGCANGEAGKILRISPSTAENHKHNAMTKLGTNKTALLTRLAIKMKISTLNERLTPAENRKGGWRGDGWN